MAEDTPIGAGRSADWHAMDAADVAALLHTDPAEGLASDEASRRLDTNGPNQLRPPEKRSAWRLFLSQFNDFMIWVLMGAVLLAALEGQVPETVAILAILLLNGVLGFVQEYRAERAMEALREMAAPTATVMRDGLEQDVSAVDLVPGDLLVLGSGDKVAADARLVEAAAMRCEEASLTGESRPAAKRPETVDDPDTPLGDRRDMVFAGTSVAVGRGLAIVVATGQATEMGRIADMLADQPDERTPLQNELRLVGRRIALAILVIAAVVFLIGALKGMLWPDQLAAVAGRRIPISELLTTQLLVAISLAVAAIPEGLPAIVTVTLSLGVHAMAGRNAIVRKLHAVETLGSTSFICTDKTGTLTRNEMVVRRMVVGEDAVEILPDWALRPSGHLPSQGDRDLLLQIASSCNDAHFTAAGDLVGDPTESALVVAADNLSDLRLRPNRIFEVPFDSDRKMMSTVHVLDGRRFLYSKGAPDVVLSLCSLALSDGEAAPITADVAARLHEANDGLAASGYRTLAFAMREMAADEDLDTGIERDLTYVGLLGMVDPPRAEVPGAVAACRAAGISVAMITGDHALTAKAIGEEIGLLDAPGARVVTGQELEHMTDDQLFAAVEDVRIYARVSPAHKLRIVEALKAHGHVVAMTGDGVNDAPALKRADIGVAMGVIGTDVSREAADMVLADDNFATIVAAVERGRVIFDNIRKFILFLLSCNVSEVLIVFIASFVSPLPALLPLQLLWNNLVTDGLPALALGVDPPSSKTMLRPPRTSDEGILTRASQRSVIRQGALITVGCLSVFLWGQYLAPDHSYETAQTMLFTTMVLSQLVHAFDFRSRDRSVFTANSLANRWLVGAFVGSLLAHLAVLYVPALQSVFHTVPLGWQDWVAVGIAAIVPVILIDLVKISAARRRPSTQAA